MKPKRSAVDRLLASRFRTCAICGKRHAKTYTITFLAEYGIIGTYAAMDCFQALPLPSNDITNVVFLTPRRQLEAGREEEEWQPPERQR